MNHTVTNYRGFAVLEALLVVVAVGAVGGTGAYVYHVKQTSDKLLHSASSEASDATPPKLHASLQATASASASTDADLQAGLNGVSSSLNQSAKDSATSNAAINDSQQEITVPTN